LDNPATLIAGAILIADPDPEESVTNISDAPATIIARPKMIIIRHTSLTG
jgi:hypothetical protein